MKYSRDDLRKGVVECLQETRRGGADRVITDRTDPIRDLGCDSPDGLDFACRLEEKFSISIPQELNPFVDDNRNRVRRVKEIVDLLENLMILEEACHDRK